MVPVANLWSNFQKSLFRADIASYLGVSEDCLMVPAMYNLCLLRADFRDHDLSAWRIVGFGAAPMPEATIARRCKQLPELELINAYGATETSSPLTALPRGTMAGTPTAWARWFPAAM